MPERSKLKDGRDEEILEPELAIIDSHHHLFERPHLRYMVDDYLDDVNAGHKVLASVYVETQAMNRTFGPVWLRPLGEIEFANGVGVTSDMSALKAPLGQNKCRVAAAIVGYADLSRGDEVAELFNLAMAIAPDRLRGFRQIAMDHSDDAVLRFLSHRPLSGLLKNVEFHRGLQQLALRGLSFDATVLHHQLPELGLIAAAHPDLTIILNHLGLAMAMGTEEADRPKIFKAWQEGLRLLSRHPNVVCKIGGLGTAYWDFGFNTRQHATGYRDLAEAWQPYVETAIEAFGAGRCMMESDYPADGRSCGFVPLWNALKYIVRDCSAADKATLFHGTAARIYRIDLPTAAAVFAS